MSKLANSHQPTMDELDRRRAIENGYEDCIPNAAEKAQHTPGPYRYEEIVANCQTTGKPLKYFFRVYAPAGISDMGGIYLVHESECYTDSSNLEQHRSNARLIAAAPDLLAIARKMAGAHQSLNGSYVVNAEDVAAARPHVSVEAL